MKMWKHSIGHAQLTRNANLASQMSLNRQPAYVECWSGLLGLYYDALKGEHESLAAEGSADLKVFHFRHAIHAGCVDTSRIALDATMSGSYVQALMLTRHLLESWLQLRYSSARPDQIARWFNTIEHGVPREPKFGSVIKEVIAISDGSTSYDKVIELLNEMNHAAHPSSWLLDQTRGDGLQMMTLGGRYDARWAEIAFDRGTFATIVLLYELGNLRASEDADWDRELSRLVDLRDTNYPGFERLPSERE